MSRECFRFFFFLLLPQSTSEGGGAAPQLQLERAIEERKVAQESVREMAERYTSLQEKFRCVSVFMASYVPSQHTKIDALLYRDSWPYIRQSSPTSGARWDVRLLTALGRRRTHRAHQSLVPYAAHTPLLHFHHRPELWRAMQRAVVRAPSMPASSIR